MDYEWDIIDVCVQHMGYVNGHNYGYDLHQLGYGPYNYAYTSPIYKAQLHPQDDTRIGLLSN